MLLVFGAMYIFNGFDFHLGGLYCGFIGVSMICIKLRNSDLYVSTFSTIQVLHYILAMSGYISQL